MISLASTFMGVIVTLTIAAFPWVLLSVPYVGGIWWVTIGAYAREREDSLILGRFSEFQVENRTSFQKRPNPSWEVVGGPYHALLDADDALSVLRRDYRPVHNPEDGAIVSQEWRIVLIVSGTEIYERSQNEVGVGFNVRLKSALKRLENALKD